jgi:uncharacterized protein YegL
MPSDRPFGTTTLAGTFSAFALGDAGARPDVDRARDFIARLVRHQTDRVKGIDYSPDMNCADLESGRIVVDPQVMLSCEFRPEATPTERLDILSGLALHEAAHQQFSSATLCATARQRGELFFSVFNLLDDEFIEMRLAEASPGYGDYLHAARRYMFGDAHRQLVHADRSLLGILVLFVRYPRVLKTADVRPWVEPLEHVRDALTPFPSSEDDVFRAAEQVFAYLVSAKGPAPSRALGSFLAKLSAHDLEPRRGRADGRRYLAGRLGRHRRTSATPQSARPSSSTRVSLPDLAAGQARAEWSVTWAYPSGDRAQYEKDSAAVRPQIVRLRRAIAGVQTRRHIAARGRRSGRLDRAKLHSLAVDNPYVFRGKEEAARRFAVVLLIDESGSMSGEKIATARQVAVLFREALAYEPAIDLFIYGHTADIPEGTTNVFCYCAPGHRVEHSLGAIEARGNNRDGVAIGAVVQHVRQRTRQASIVMFVLSDGVPNAHVYSGQAALDHTRRVVKEARSVRIIHVGIAAEARHMISADSVSFTQLSELPRQMQRLLERVLARE